MTVEKFYRAMLRQEAAASVRLDGQTQSLPRFQTGQRVWIVDRPAQIVGYDDQDRICRAHRNEVRYLVRLAGSPPGAHWPYCESQIRPRD